MVDKLCGNCKLCDFSSDAAKAKALDVGGNMLVRAATQLSNNSEILKTDDMGKRLERLQESLDDATDTLLDALYPRGIKQCSGMEGVVTSSNESCTNPMYYTPLTK
jgi:hypothetical protein